MVEVIFMLQAFKSQPQVNIHAGFHLGLVGGGGELDVILLFGGEAICRSHAMCYVCRKDLGKLLQGWHQQIENESLICIPLSRLGQ